jgi:hypothetical protein
MLRLYIKKHEREEWIQWPTLLQSMEPGIDISREIGAGHIADLDISADGALETVRKTV